LQVTLSSNLSLSLDTPAGMRAANAALHGDLGATLACAGGVVRTLLGKLQGHTARQLTRAGVMDAHGLVYLRVVVQAVLRTSDAQFKSCKQGDECQ
jgi:hypothetical protein